MGTVGWGVLGNFGSREKDEGTQEVVHKASSACKMIKNDKGLWVKVKSNPTIDIAPQKERKANSLVLDPDDYQGVARKHKEDIVDNSTTKDNKKYQGSTSYKTERRRSRSGSINKRRNVDQSRSRHRSRSDSRDGKYERRHRENRRSRSNSRDQQAYSRRSRSRSRSRSASYDRRRHKRNTSRRDRRDVSRSRSDSRYTKKYDKINDGGKYHRRGSKSDTPNRDDRLNEDKRIENLPNSIPKHLSSDDHVKDGDSSHSDKDKDVVMVMDEANDSSNIVMEITALQVVNRFLEIYSSKKYFADNAKWIDAIVELFTDNSSIANLKNGKIHIQGLQNISNSFIAAIPCQCSPCKRVFISSPFSEGTSSCTVTFCFDVYKAGLSPGLGDPLKDTLVLYRCEGAKVSHVWGMVDKENLAASPTLTLDILVSSNAWKSALMYIVRDMPSMVESDSLKIIDNMHFHNYETIDVWQ